jgi:hypothetical protein
MKNDDNGNETETENSDEVEPDCECAHQLRQRKIYRVLNPKCPVHGKKNHLQLV